MIWGKEGAVAGRSVQSMQHAEEGECVREKTEQAPEGFHIKYTLHFIMYRFAKRTAKCMTGRRLGGPCLLREERGNTMLFG